MSISEQIDTSTAAGRMVVNMLGVIAAWESTWT
jgi:DNA invertase Pin-like site-specific DNA recombinase